MAKEMWQPVSRDDPRQDFDELRMDLEAEAARLAARAALMSPIWSFVDRIPKVLRTQVEGSVPLPNGSERVPSVTPSGGDENLVARAAIMLAQKLLVQRSS